ncbi:DUF4862 family protein [Pseudarthrobacter sp. H2]|uniref:DUF4862 family protein n=1 Tax=Pseudarthrobacter sp. H2 TaxID=3418415 RepID=UPI003CF5C77E
MSLIVGAYPAQNPGAVQQPFFEELAGISSIRGLELLYRASGGDLWPAGAPDAWSAVVTAIPGTMQRLGLDGNFGLASTDSGGRRSAVDFVAGIKDYVAALTDAGHPVEAVELHSAPPHHASGAAFGESLAEILGWDWHGTTIVIEHCDAPRVGRAPEKGFLRFEEEIRVVRSLREQGLHDIGVLVNWARSVIETGESRTAAEHIRYAREAGVLTGLMFSGCSPETTEFGYPWIDAHLPAVEVQGAPASSLLNAGEIARCLDEAGELPITGFKIGLPQDAVAPADRVARLRQMCNVITEGFSAGTGQRPEFSPT